ncbi:phage replisome organizer N-terminal domain-containing protein [Pediococcus argentinicus]|uniref:phage replisome organizer N-terminal domain-containing protein n=1 Tax=Pediococcus argentinicus TaxID=480391 RepID=UPI00338FA038
MADVSWIKLKTDMFEDEKIKLIQAMPESDAILIVWIRLLTLAGKVNDDGRIYIQENLSYTDEELSVLFNKPLNVVRLALQTLSRFNMIGINKNGILKIKNWEKHQNVDGLDKIRLQSAERNKRYRARKKEQKLLEKRDVSVTSRDATDIDKDKEEESNNKVEFKFKEFFEYFNKMTGKNYRNIKTNQDMVRARLNDGFTNKDLKLVIDYKTSEWKGNPDMDKYLRPSTLFQPSKFNNYLEEATNAITKSRNEFTSDGQRKGLTAEEIKAKEEAQMRALVEKQKEAKHE